MLLAASRYWGDEELCGPNEGRIGVSTLVFSRAFPPGLQGPG
jgi:hypothetical protein